MHSLSGSCISNTFLTKHVFFFKLMSALGHDIKNDVQHGKKALMLSADSEGRSEHAHPYSLV